MEILAHHMRKVVGSWIGENSHIKADKNHTRRKNQSKKGAHETWDWFDMEKYSSEGFWFYIRALKKGIIRPEIGQLISLLSELRPCGRIEFVQK